MSDKMNKIVYVPETFPQPSETFVINEISGLLDNGYDITVIPRAPGSSSVIKHENLTKVLSKVPVVYNNQRTAISALLPAFKYGGQNKFGKHPKAIINKLKNTLAIANHVARIKEHNPDIIIIHFGFDNAVAGIIAAKTLNVPVILWFHGSDMHTVPHRSLHWLTSEATTVITNSIYSVNLLKKLGVNTNVVKSYLGVNVNKFNISTDSSTRNKLIIICVARLGHHKNHQALFDTFSEIKNMINDAELWLVGDGPLKSDYQALVTETALDNVIFWGALAQEEIVKLLQQAHLKILLSENEALGVAFIEAHAVGLPCLATKIGGIPEVIVDGETGFLFDLESETLAEDVANKVVSLYKDTNLYKKMSDSARERVLNVFDEKIHIKFMNELILNNLKKDN